MQICALLWLALNVDSAEGGRYSANCNRGPQFNAFQGLFFAILCLQSGEKTVEDVALAAALAAHLQVCFSHLSVHTMNTHTRTRARERTRTGWWKVPGISCLLTGFASTGGCSSANSLACSSWKKSDVDEAAELVCVLLPFLRRKPCHLETKEKLL